MGSLRKLSVFKVASSAAIGLAGVLFGMRNKFSMHHNL